MQEYINSTTRFHEKTILKEVSWMVKRKLR